MCIDSTGGMDRSHGHLFNLVIPGPVGSLSCGMFISFSETKNTIEKGLDLLKQLWVQNNAVQQDFYPKVFMSDDCSAQINALNSIFPESKILLCQFHVGNALWKWLHSNIKDENRIDIMNAFKKIMHTRDDFDQMKSNLFTMGIVQNNKKLFKHLQLVFRKEKLFCRYFTQEHELLGANTNNLIERSFLTIKQNFLDRYKCFNAIHLIIKISEKYDVSVKTNLIDYINNRSTYEYRNLLHLETDFLKGISKNILNFEFGSNLPPLDKFSDLSNQLRTE